jgi:hypothetical protein
MHATGDRTVRYCPQCRQPVHWVGSYHEFKHAAQLNQCIAFEPADVLLTAEHAQTSKAERKQFLLLEKQKLSLKQLAHVKRYLHPDRSFRELRESYHNKASIIKYDPNKEDVETVANILRGLGIKINVKREETV